MFSSERHQASSNQKAPVHYQGGSQLKLVHNRQQIQLQGLILVLNLVLEVGTRHRHGDHQDCTLHLLTSQSPPAGDTSGLGSNVYKTSWSGRKEAMMETRLSLNCDRKLSGLVSSAIYQTDLFLQ